MSPNVTPMPRYGKKTDLEVFEPTNDVEKKVRRISGGQK